MEEKYTWNLTDIFKTKEEFEKEIEKLNEMLNEIKTYQGKLSNSSENIYQCYRNVCGKIYRYAKTRMHKKSSGITKNGRCRLRRYKHI